MTQADASPAGPTPAEPTSVEPTPVESTPVDATQGDLLGPRRPVADTGVELAPVDPVARVHVTGLLPHLDRPFDYVVPAELDGAVPGTRVRVKFAGRARDGVVVERVAHAATDRPLASLTSLVSPLPVLTDAVRREVREVADRCAGTFADVLRFALPPRHARAERRALEAAVPGRTTARAGDDPAGDDPAGDDRSRHDQHGAEQNGTEQHGTEQDGTGPGALGHYVGGPAFAARLAGPDRSDPDRSGPDRSRHGRPAPVPRAAIALRPVDTAAGLVWDAIRALPPHRGALVLLPDLRDVDRMLAACPPDLAEDTVRLSSHDGPERRYGAFVRILRGVARIVIGNRSAAFAPVQDLGLIVVLDDGDDLHAEPRAPYPHTRVIASVRSHVEEAPLLLIGHSRSVEAEDLVRQGWLADLLSAPVPREDAAPRLDAMDDYLREREGPTGWMRLPSLALRTLRDGLTRGPVLVQVPRSGYVPALACTHCGTRARCTACNAHLAPAPGGREIRCTVCGRSGADHVCPDCGRRGLRAVATGSGRTAEELRRALPEAALVLSGGQDGAIAEIGEDPVLVVATPGAEPVAPAGYAAAVLMDGSALLGRAALDADVEALRRWLNASALVRPAREGGRVLAVVDAALPPVQALIRTAPVSYARRALRERAELQLPPVTKCAELSGDAAAVHGVVAGLDLPPGAEVFGPLPTDETRARAIVKCAPTGIPGQLAALRGAVAAHTARKRPGSVTVRVDPIDVF